MFVAPEPSMGTSTQQYNLFDSSYEILRAVGRGRNSVVYEARALHSLPTDAVVALKVLLGNAKHPEYNRQRMRHESLAMLSSRHPNVIRLNDFVETPELCYMSLEYADRGDLFRLLEESESPLDVFTVVRYMIQVLDGLCAIHRGGIIHRDIKPENLLLTSDDRIKIADFGIAHLPTEQFSLKDITLGVGTFDYLAPECLERGEATPSVDVYSVGVTCYQLLTKNLPFSGKSFAEQIDSKLRGRRLPLGAYLRNYPTILEEVLVKALNPNPQQRFSSASEFRDALLAVQEYTSPQIGDVPITETKHIQEKNAPQTRVESGPSWTKTIRTFLERGSSWIQQHRVGSAIALLTCILGVVALSQNHPSESPLTTELSETQVVPISLRTSNILNQYTRGVHGGLIYGLLGPENDTSIVMTPADDRHTMIVVSLGIDGYVPESFDVDSFLTHGTVLLSSSGFKLRLVVDAAKTSEDRIEGTYRDLISGKTGSWVLW